MSGLPFVCDGYVIFKCTACGGSGTVMVFPDGIPPPDYVRCKTCKGIGIVRVPIEELATIRGTGTGNPKKQST